jgi:hypothetical protein
LHRYVAASKKEEKKEEEERRQEKFRGKDIRWGVGGDENKGKKTSFEMLFPSFHPIYDEKSAFQSICCFDCNR